MLLFVAARRPDVRVEVNTNVTHANAYYEKQGNIYSVGIGQEFGLVCTTSGFFEVYWYHGDMRGEEVVLNSTYSTPSTSISKLWRRLDCATCQLQFFLRVLRIIVCGDKLTK